MWVACNQRPKLVIWRSSSVAFRMATAVLSVWLGAV